MPTIEESVQVDVPVSEAYDQWTRFEDFPQFMDGIKEVRRLDDTRLHWVAEVGGKTEEWDAEVTEQEPGERIAWRSTGGKQNAGVVTFQRLDDRTSKVMLEMSWEAEGAVEKVGSALGQDDRKVKGDLDRFKEFVEGHGWGGAEVGRSSR